MKQLFQPLDGSELKVWEIDPPAVPEGWFLVRTRYSCISPGTERMLTEFAQANWLDRARKRPDLVKKTLDKISKDGLKATLSAIRTRMNRPLPLGYSIVGEVIEAPEKSCFGVGDIVAAGGAGIANHAEFAAVPANLCVRLPKNLDQVSASTVTLGAIALQSVREIEPKLGDVVVVLGGGVLGQLAKFLAEQSGCEVFIFDPVSSRGNDLSGGFSDFDELQAVVKNRTKGFGADAVIVSASSESSAVMTNAISLIRTRGIVSVLGQVPMGFSRNDAYEKSATIRFAKSYGPGRYDPRYEQSGVDYPYEHVRYTENRNMEAYLGILAKYGLPASINLERVSLDGVPEFFISGKLVGVIGFAESEHRFANVPNRDSQAFENAVSHPDQIKRLEDFQKKPSLVWIGPGEFATSVLLPKILKMKVPVLGIVSRDSSKYGPLNQMGLKNISEQEALDSESPLVFITTRHENHGRLVIDALKRKKIIFCEKPLTIKSEEQDEIESLVKSGLGPVLVGHNRRFAPVTSAVQKLLENVNGFEITYRINAGQIPTNHWLMDSKHGGRVLGECGHFIDWARAVIQRPIVKMNTIAPGKYAMHTQDNSTVIIDYSTLGNSSVKELIQIDFGGKSWKIRDFRDFEGFSQTISSGKGHEEEMDFIFKASPREWIETAWETVLSHRLLLEAENLYLS